VGLVFLLLACRSSSGPVRPLDAGAVEDTRRADLAAIDTRDAPGAMLDVSDAAGDPPRDGPGDPPSIDAPPAAAVDYGKVSGTKAEIWARLTGFPEGPSYRSDGSVLLCAPSLVRVTPDRKRLRMLPFDCLGSVVLGDGTVLVAGQDGLYQVLTDGRVALLAAAAGANDLSVDRTGNVYFSASGALHVVRPDGAHQTLTADIAANGVEVDPASQSLYVSQTGMNQISRYDLPADGQPLGRATVALASVPTPDGITFDAGGNLWVALHTQRKVGIYDVTARRQLAVLDVPVETTVQNLAFGGSANDVLFVVGGNFDANALLLRYPVGVPGFRTNPGAAAYRPLRFLDAMVTETPF
jgi:sugar lactone lactonase YvrE